MTGDTPTFRIAVLASGTGSNLQAIIDSVHGRTADDTKKHAPVVELALVVSDKPGCKALKRAVAAGIAIATFPAGEFVDPVTHQPDRVIRDRAMAQTLHDAGIELVVLAGYMQILSEDFVRAFENRLINVHPSLLPKYPGLNAIEQALKAGESETGVTVHYVDEGVDTGPVVAQQSVPIDPGEPAEGLATRIHAVEHQLLPRVIRELAVAARTATR